MQVTHLLYLSQKPGQNPFSGAETPTLALVGRLAKAGITVELLVVEWNSGGLIDRRLEGLEREGVRVTRVTRRQRGWPRGRLVRAMGCWWRLGRELRKPRPIVHVHLDLVVAPVLCWLGRVGQVVATIHSDDPSYRSVTWRLWSRVLSRLVDRFVAISDRVAAYYSDVARLDRRGMQVIRYPVAREPPDPVLVAATRPAEARFVVGVIARLARQKNLVLLGEVLRREPHWHGVVVGEGPERTRIERFVAEHRMSNLRLLGAIPGARRLMTAFDVLVLPSSWEGLGLVLVEAMLAGVPVVGSRAGAIPEVLGEGRFGLLFEPGSADDLHTKLRMLHEGAIDVAAMTAAARREAEVRFAPDRVTREMLALYRSLPGE